MDPHFDGVIFQTHASELKRRMRSPSPPFCILDVRPSDVYASGHISGAVNTDVEELASGLPEGTSPGTEFFIVGRGPQDPAVRETTLALGRVGARRRVELSGGMLEWQHLGYPVERGERAA